MILDQLVRLVPPPDIPAFAEGDWSTAEARLGFAVPDDYRQLIATFGSGTFCGEFTCWSPFGVDDADMARFVEQNCESLRSGRHPAIESTAVWPEPGGVLPWGTDGCGNMLAWYPREGPPANWGCVIVPEEGWPFHSSYAFGAVELLYRAHTGGIDTPDWALELDGPGYFDPWGARLEGLRAYVRNSPLAAAERQRASVELLDSPTRIISGPTSQHLYVQNVNWRIRHSSYGDLDHVSVKCPGYELPAVREFFNRLGERLGRPVEVL